MKMKKIEINDLLRKILINNDMLLQTNFLMERVV